MDKRQLLERNYVDEITGEYRGAIQIVEGGDGLWAVVLGSDGKEMAELFLNMFYMNAPEKDGGPRFKVSVQIPNGDPVVHVDIEPGLAKVFKEMGVAHSHHPGGDTYYVWEVE